MKYIIIILSIFLINHTANADYKIEKLLKFCKIAERYDYGLDTGRMNDEEYAKSLVCRTYIIALASVGIKNCALFNVILTYK